ncbi:hypothetical protein GCM10007147_03810 [Nocardiopsis kunsanensis]|uniref:DUF397 domain-containing protein n=1 Tax=Nocardiopsis kunsanensis TaxID=141693 RepID=A0A918X7T4_9ACTN|nr:DUF397 domain-containing protein [Nocardiopsis kunsanensis]GHD15900.1 hypothetical protein GCM10007147_03810 [Nocardiopsis kunsanensis]
MSHRFEFRKSSYSGRGQDCVEVARFRTSGYSAQRQEGVHPYGAAMRDSKHPDAGHLPFPASEWTGFLSAALR